MSDSTNQSPTDRYGYDRSRMVTSSTKPTAFQQYLNDHPQPKARGVLHTVAAKAKTYDEGKLPLAWLPWAAIDELSKVQQYGHEKYKDFNNYRKGMEVSRNLSCALRHIRDYLEGHDVDAESGHSPLAHAMCRIAFVLQNLKEGTAIDDRYKTQKPFNPDLEAVIKESLRNKP